MLAKPAPWFPGLNRAHPLARDLRLLCPFWEGAGTTAADLLDNRRHFTYLPAKWSATAAGRGFDVTTGNPLHMTAENADRCNDLNPGGFTVSTLIDVPGTDFGNGAQTIFATFDARLEGEWSLQVTNQLHRIYFYQYQSGAKSAAWYSTPPVPVPPLPALLHLTITGNSAGTLLGYVNDNECGIPSVGTFGPPVIHGTPTGLGFCTYFAGKGNTAQFYAVPVLAAIWARVLTPAEVKALHADPFALIAPPSGLMALAGGTLPPSAASLGFDSPGSALDYTARGEPLDYESPYT